MAYKCPALCPKSWPRGAPKQPSEMSLKLHLSSTSFSSCSTVFSHPVGVYPESVPHPSARMIWLGVLPWDDYLFLRSQASSVEEWDRNPCLSLLSFPKAPGWSPSLIPFGLQHVRPGTWGMWPSRIGQDMMEETHTHPGTQCDNAKCFCEWFLQGKAFNLDQMNKQHETAKLT